MSGPASWPGFVAVGIGAVAGAWCRWGLALWLNGSPRLVPLGTLLANVGGGLLIGLAAAWLSRHPELHPAWRLMLVTGFLGALTTFSTFSLESLTLLQRGHAGAALLHASLHLFGSLAAAAIGYWILSD
ncbi:MAG: fluoride efflux transporter CrcB [Burkholderiaceae bacterium]